MPQNSTVRLAGLLGSGIALAAAGAFYAAATVAGHAPVARYGGAVWVGLLVWIITMPVLAPLLRRRA